jgi:hypothetical protein
MDCNIKQRSEVTRLTKTIQHRQLDNAVRDIADLIGCVGFLDARFDSVSFLELPDTPTSYSGLAGYQVVVNGTEDGLDFVAPGGGADGNTWDIPSAAFVDPANGNNSTAVVGDGNKPYSSVFTALSNSDYVILKPGTYTSLANITVDNKHIHAMEGVRIVSGGIRVQGAGVTNFKFSGKAVWDGRLAYILRINDTNANIDFEFSHALNCNRILFEDSVGFGLFPYVKMTADFIRCNCINGTAYATRLRTGATFEFNIKYYVESVHDVWYGRQCGAGGRFIVNCPESRIIDDYETFSYGNANRSVVRISDSAFDTDFIINGDCVSNYTPPTTYEIGVVHSFATFSAVDFPTLEVNGDVIGNNQPCITTDYRSLHGEFNFNGNLIARSTVGLKSSAPIWLELAAWGGASKQIWRFNGSIITGGTRVIAGRGKELHFKDCAVYNDDIDNLDSIIFCAGGGTTPAEIYSYNSSFEKGGAIGLGSELVKGNVPTAVIGTVNTTANVPVGATYLDIWGTGYAAIPNFIVTKLP